MNAPLPKAWSEVTPESLRGIQGVCLDIDDTLSTEGKLTSEAYAALWSLKKAGFSVIPITGRPAGWCDHIARFWPVDAVVGENGAFTFFMQGGVRRRLETPGGEPERVVKLKRLREKILQEFPHARFASDQAYRENDLAIDICEDVPTWPREQVDALLKLCHEEGAHAKLSSIHVNTWYGAFDKKSGFKACLGEAGLGLPLELERWIYIGDSPNDEPMFSAFPLSVGVANLKQYLTRLKSPPTYLTNQESGAGFVEMAEKLIHAREYVKASTKRDF